MKVRFLFFSILIISNYAFSQTGWFDVSPEMTLNQHGDICVIDENIVYVISDGGLFYKTIDGGINWTEINVNVNEQYYGIAFIDNNIGFIVGANGTLLKTNDAGINWNIINTGTIENIHSICIADTNNIWCVGENGTILHTNDGGNSWDLNISITTSNLYDIKFIDNSTGIIVGQNDLILKTIDAGTTWNSPTSSTDFFGDGFSISISNSVIRFISGGVYGDNYGENFGLGVFKSNDEGETWDIEYEYPICASSHMSSIDFINGNIGFLIDFHNSYENGTILKMTDGVNYDYISHNFNTLEMNRFYSNIKFYNDNIVYFLSGDTILKTIDGGVYVNAIDDFEEQIVSIYPNPSKDILLIKSDYNIISNTTIYDITGKVIMKSKEKSISLRNFTKGLYFIKIRFKDNTTIIRKVIKE